MAEESFNLETNVPVDVEFLYDNVTSGISKKDKRWYAFATQHGKMWAENYLVRSILQAWQGKGCTMRITKLSEEAYRIDDIVQGDGAPLAMKEWDQTSKAFVQVKFDLDGLTPLEAAEVPEGAAVAPGVVTHPKPNNAVQGSTVAYRDLVNLMGACLGDAFLAWKAETDDHDLEGDACGAVERIAVSLYIDARKIGVAPVYGAAEQVAEVFDGDPGPQERDEADDLDLPF